MAVVNGIEGASHNAKTLGRLHVGIVIPEMWLFGDFEQVNPLAETGKVLER
jgi:hypothetical protein